jgi:hypothetical protein
MKFVIWILKTLLGKSFILLLPLPLFSGRTGVAKVVVKLVLQSEPLHVLTLQQTALIHTFQQISPSFLLPHLCTYGRGCLGPSNSSQAYSCSSSKFLKSLSCSFSIKPLNPYRVMNTLCRAARAQTLDNIVLIVVSNGAPSSLTSPTLITSISNVVCDLGCH